VDGRPVADLGEGPGGPLILDKKDGRKDEKPDNASNPSLSSSSSPSLAQCLDQPLGLTIEIKLRQSPDYQLAIYLID